MDTNHANAKLLKQPGENILEDIWKAFQREDTIRSIDLQNISVTVEQGQVILSGHVSKDLNYQHMEEIARAVNGVLAVHNHLVTDRDLTIQVAQSLAKDERVRPLILPVYCDHGWIALGGEVPSREVQQAAEVASARVATVRGVISLPKVTGERGEAFRPVIQPRIGARVYGGNGTEGIVNQVIIRPENRLVTAVVVRIGAIEDIWLVTHDYVVPVEAMDVVNQGGIILKNDAPALDSFPAFYSPDYPIASLTWEPPYPYSVGKVRWPREGTDRKDIQMQNAERPPEEKIGIPEWKLTR